MTSCKVCHLNKSKHSGKLWALHQQAQICALCQKNASEHSEKLWDMHKNAIEKGRFCPFHKKIEKLYPITIGSARASLARVCKTMPQDKPFGTILSLPGPPYDVDFVPIHMKCSNPNCKLYLSHIEEDRADVLDGLCLKCFRELPEHDTVHEPLKDGYESNKIKPVLNIWSGEMVTSDPFDQNKSKKTKEVN